MKANDLRIGNWVYVVDKESTPKKTPVQVNLTWLQIAEALEPIPLTTDLLLNAGMEVSEDLGDMVFYEFPNLSYGYGVCYDHEEWEFYRYSGGDHRALIHDAPFFQYLHQLQNLFYSLTGEELEINLS